MGNGLSVDCSSERFRPQQFMDEYLEPTFKTL